MNNKIYCSQGKCECKYIEDVSRYSKDVPELYKQLETLQETNQKQSDRIKELEEALTKITNQGCSKMYTCGNCKRDFSFQFKCKGTICAEIATRTLQPQEESK